MNFLCVSLDSRGTLQLWLGAAYVSFRMNIMAGQWWLLLLLADRGVTTLTIRLLVLA